MAGLPHGGAVRLEVEMGVPTLPEIVVNDVSRWGRREAPDFGPTWKEHRVIRGRSR